MRAGRLAAFGWADFLLAAGLLAIALPTLVLVGRSTWSSESGAHGPIILATGLWLLVHKWPEVRHLVRPPSAGAALLVFVLAAPVYLLARITQIVELEGYAMYLLALGALYAIVGWRVMRALAFPLIYLFFAFPPPETLIYTLTLPIKVAITQSSIAMLQFAGLPIGGTGVMIQIGQYQLLVAAACSGLNSIVSLSALTLFYIYMMHQHERRRQLILLAFVLPVAIAVNFLRVLILILLTYYAGEGVAQSFLHDLAGVTTFVLALLLMASIDAVLGRVMRRRQPAGYEVS
ncbi:exosortase V [Tsuneonella sp. HG249]